MLIFTRNGKRHLEVHCTWSPGEFIILLLVKRRPRLDQPGKKKSRRLKRASKAAAFAPKPVSRLYPVVQCPTQKHCSKTRLGRGFSLAELKAAKITPQFAKTVGIAVDHRRINKSADSLLLNVQRLESYKAKLVVFPKKGNKAKAGDTAESAVRSAATQSGKIPVMPAKTIPAFEFAPVDDKMKQANAYQEIRHIRNSMRLEGVRAKLKKERDADKKN
mmetsp:Transcript_25895/g.78007  ORF Transcript_25895/g.78007 Transcript_25895/m.78007 type:complete len:218 (-) Transcript_25895:209-862(-)